jgi:L-amino acid N-acyltransferase YncA
MKIRPATKADVPAILDIYNDAVLTTTATYDYEPRTLLHRMEWFEAHEKINFPIFVAETDAGRIVGWSALNRYHDRAGYRFTSENSIYIAADSRGQGIGKLLLAPLVESAKQLGLRAIIAVIDAENEASVKLHARFGFIEVGRFPKVGFKFGRWLDVAYMELLLPEPDAERLKWPPPAPAR